MKQHRCRQCAWRMVVIGALLVLRPTATLGRAHPSGTWNARLAVEQAYNDNVEQKSGIEMSEDFITNLTGELGWENRRKRSRRPRELGLTVRGHVYHNIPDFNFVEIEPEGACRLWRHTDLVLGYAFSPRRRLFDEGGDAGTVLYTEHAVAAGLRHKFGRRKRLRAELGFEAEWKDYRQAHNERDAFTPGLVLGVRYHLGFPLRRHWELTPRFALEYGRRHARRANFDRDEIALIPGCDLRLPLGLVLRFRYKRSMRDYVVSDPTGDGRRNNNFRREDDFQQYQTWLAVPFPALTGLSLHARYRFRGGTFDVPNRKETDPSGRSIVGVKEHFNVHEVGLEVSYVF